MNFKPELAEAVMARRKTVTRRKVSDNPRSPWWRDRCAYRVGQDVAICPGRGKHAIGRARIIDVRLDRLIGVREDGEAQREGFATWTGFMEAWRAINGRYSESELVWRIELEALPS